MKTSMFQNQFILKTTFFVGTLGLLMLIFMLLSATRPAIAEGAESVNREQRMETLRREQIQLERELLIIQSEYDRKLTAKIEAERVLQAKLEELAAVETQGKAIRADIATKDSEIMRLRDRVNDTGF